MGPRALPLIPALRKLRSEDGGDLEARLGRIVRAWLKKEVIKVRKDKERAE